jgi:chromate transport protein ChrA
MNELLTDFVFMLLAIAAIALLIAGLYKFTGKAKTRVWLPLIVGAFIFAALTYERLLSHYS